MKIEGFVRIEKFVNGELTEAIEQQNLVTANFYKAVLGFLAVNPNPQIFISSNTETPRFDIERSEQLPDMAYGSTPTGITSPIFIDSVTPNFAQYQAQFDRPTSQRTFQTVGLFSNNSPGGIIAYLRLDTPCTQNTNEFLNIFYRLQFTNTSNILTDQVVNSFGRAITVQDVSFDLVSTAYYFGNISPNVLSKYTKPYAEEHNLIRGIPGSNFPPEWSSGERVDSHFKFKQKANFPEEEQVGKIINQILYGYYSPEKYAYYLDKTNNPSAIQAFFTHSSGATKPFFDPLNLAANENNLINLAGTWTGKFPEFYKITITKSGATGIAEYKFGVRKWLGFAGNTYTDQYVVCPYLNTNAPAAINMHGWKKEDCIDKLRFSDTQLVEYDSTGITLLDVINGEYTTWDAKTTPALSVTQLRQCAVDTVSKKIYCACRATGLWVIDVVTNTITNPIASPCYGVDVGKNNTAFIITTGGIVKSTNYSVTLPVDITNLATCQFLKADPASVDDNLAIVVNTSETTYQIKWYVASTQAISDGSTYEVKPFPGCFDVSDVGSLWAGNGVLYTFGTDSLNYVSGPFGYDDFTHSIYGSYRFHKVDFYKNFLIADDKLVRSDGTTEILYEQPLYRAPYQLHLTDGIVVYGSRLRQLFTDNLYCYKNYGWNGSAWVEGSTTSKITHAAVQPLLNGITIAFQNAPSGPTWTNTNYYTFAAANGLVKDNATTFYVDFSWYSAPALFNQPYTATIPTSLQLTFPAASDPSFITLEVDSPQVHVFKINNVLVTFVRVDGSAPAPNEVTIAANGVVKFNAADVGKTFTSLYAYVKV